MSLFSDIVSNIVNVEQERLGLAKTYTIVTRTTYIYVFFFLQDGVEGIELCG